MGPNEKADACLQKAQQVGARHVWAAHEMEETGAVWLVPSSLPDPVTLVVYELLCCCRKGNIPLWSSLRKRNLVQARLGLQTLPRCRHFSDWHRTKPH